MTDDDRRTPAETAEAKERPGEERVQRRKKRSLAMPNKVREEMDRKDRAIEVK